MGRGNGSGQRHHDPADIHLRPGLDPQPLQPPPPSQSPRHFHTRPRRRPGRVASTCSLRVLDGRCFGSSLISLTMPHRESPQPNAPRAAPCETLARRDDGAALGGRRGARSGEGVPPGARMSRYARAGRCPPGTRRAVRTRGVVRDGCVVVNQAAAEFQQRTGHPPEPGRLDQSFSGRFLNIATLPVCCWRSHVPHRRFT